MRRALGLALSLASVVCCLQPLSLVHGRIMRRTATPLCVQCDPPRTDEEWMLYALSLAERGRYSTAPNPWYVRQAPPSPTLVPRGI